MQILTKREKEVLSYIEEYTNTYKEAPRFRDIQYHFGFSSLGTVNNYISNLQKKGALTKEKQKRRSLLVTQIEDEEIISKELRVPFVGYIAAGFPIETFPQPKEITVPSIWVQSPQITYVLRVIGNSLHDEFIDDGDFLVIEARQEAAEGERVIALINEHESLVKKYYSAGEMIRFESCSNNQEPLFVQPFEVKIQGVLIGLLRLF